MTSASTFIPGLILNRRFYWEVVRPLLDQHLPQLVHSAALIGYGSDVLGLDTEMSTDHNWGPRVQIYLSAEDFATHETRLDELLSENLPATFAGYPVNFSEPDLADNGTRRMAQHQGGTVRHMLSIATVEQRFQDYLGIAPDANLCVSDWLLLPEQKLLEMTAGEVFHDGLGTLNPARQRIAYYPDDIWKMKLTAQWSRISEEEAFVGRTGDLGDNIGSWIVAARITRDLMRLAFLYARRYAPYSKWLGFAFARLPIAADLLPHMRALTTSQHWKERETYLVALYRRMAEEHNTSSITEPLSAATQNYFGRPFQVLFAERFAEAIQATIRDPDLCRFATVGAVDQFTDSVAIHSNARLAAKLKGIYTTP